MPNGLIKAKDTTNNKWVKVAATSDGHIKVKKG
jgi:hypothetical protein